MCTFAAESHSPLIFGDSLWMSRVLAERRIVLLSYGSRCFRLQLVGCFFSLTRFWYVSFVLYKNKVRKPFIYRGFRTFLWGAWRIRTAVDGFADRWLSHSSKAPSKRVKSDTSISSFERKATRPKGKAPFLECGCKGSHYFLHCQMFSRFFRFLLQFFAKAQPLQASFLSVRALWMRYPA